MALADVENIGDVLCGMPALLVLVGIHNVLVVMVRTTRTLWEGNFEGLVNLSSQIYHIFQRGGRFAHAGGNYLVPPGGLLRRWVKIVLMVVSLGGLRPASSSSSYKISEAGMTFMPSAISSFMRWI